ncbi:MAG: hypothetical protein H6Q14_1098 [Bacteroidetes bacterium]|nr:hypothetical protein [Bacteroidota bacterium]
MELLFQSRYGAPVNTCTSGGGIVENLQKIAMKKNIFLLIMLCSLSACHLMMDGGMGFDVANKTNDSLWVYVGIGGIGGTLYPDTALAKIQVGTISPPLTNTSISYDGNNISELFDGAKTDTISVFIISKDTLNKYGWSYVRNNYKVLRRYDASLQDFQSLDLKLTYPPSSNMSGMKMYPPYGK